MGSNIAYWGGVSWLTGDFSFESWESLLSRIRCVYFWPDARTSFEEDRDDFIILFEDLRLLDVVLSLVSLDKLLSTVLIDFLYAVDFSIHFYWCVSLLSSSRPECGLDTLIFCTIFFWLCYVTNFLRSLWQYLNRLLASILVACPWVFFGLCEIGRWLVPREVCFLSCRIAVVLCKFIW